MGINPFAGDIKHKTLGQVAGQIAGTLANPLGAVSTAIGDAIDATIGEIGSALGLSKTEADYRKERYRKFYKQVALGNLPFIDNVARRSQYPGLRTGASWILRQAHNGVSVDAVERYLNAETGEASRAGTAPDLEPDGGAGWVGTTGTVPDAEPPSPSPTRPGSGSNTPASPPIYPEDSAPPAESESPRTPRQKRTYQLWKGTEWPIRRVPIAIGVAADADYRTLAQAEDAGYYSKKKAASGRAIADAVPGAPGSGPVAAGFVGQQRPCAEGKERNPVTGRCVARCKYGARGPDGKCPKKPKRARRGVVPITGVSSIDRQINALAKKAAVAASKKIEAGVAGATASIKAALSAAGIDSAAAAAGAGLAIAAAGALGWFIGRSIDETLSGRPLEERKVQIALDRVHARLGLAKALGVFDENAPGAGLSKEQQAGITQAYEIALARLEGKGPPLSTEEASQALVDEYQAQRKIESGR